MDMDMHWTCNAYPNSIKTRLHVIKSYPKITYYKKIDTVKYGDKGRYTCFKIL